MTGFGLRPRQHQADASKGTWDIGSLDRDRDTNARQNRSLQAYLVIAAGYLYAFVSRFPPVLGARSSLALGAGFPFAPLRMDWLFGRAAPGQGKKRGRKNRRERTPETEEDEQNEEYFTIDTDAMEYELEEQFNTINQNDPPEIIEREGFAVVVSWESSLATGLLRPRQNGGANAS